MKTQIIQDELGTHIDWAHDAVTPRMIDWFWSNMEKGFILWHPEQHEPLEWAVPPVHGNPIGSIHIAPQTWNDGSRQNLYIRFEDLNDVPDNIKEVIVYEHCVIVAGLGLGRQCLENPDPMGYRIHQWQKTDSGVKGKSSGIGTRIKETPEQGMVWSAHCIAEISNWSVFLPDLYRLYKVVKNTKFNPFADLSVEGKGKNLRYKHITPATV